MMHRRSLLAIFAAGFAAAFAPQVEAAVPDRDAKPRIPAFSIPRGVVVKFVPVDQGYETETFREAARAGLIAYPTIDLISTGRELVLWDSPEGQAIARETAVNLRSDGTLRHRQHHWPR